MTLQIVNLTSLAVPNDPLGVEQIAVGPISGAGTLTGSGAFIHVWQQGIVTDIGVAGRAFGVNDFGWVVGEESAGNGSPALPFLWANNTLITLPQLTSANALNGRGQIPGTITVGSGSAAEPEAVVYQNGQVTVLGMLPTSYANASSTPYAINDPGDIVGSSVIAQNVSHAFLWKNGVMTDLGALAAGHSTYAYALNGEDQVVGGDQILSGQEVSQAFLWQKGTMTALPQLQGDTYSYATGINDSGMIVGVSQSSSGDAGSARATLWYQGQAIDLNTLLPSNSGWVLTAAEGISNTDQIVGTGTFDGVSSSFTLTLGASAVGQIGVAAQTAILALTNVNNSILPISVIDSSADVQASLDGLQRVAAAGKLSSIILTDDPSPTYIGNMPIETPPTTVTVTDAQFIADTSAIAAFKGNYMVVSPTASVAGFSGYSGHSYLLQADNGGIAIEGRGFSALLTGVDLIKFDDFSVIAAATPQAGIVTSGNLAELYSAAFGRMPDIGGLAFYQGYLQAHPSTQLLQFAEWFLNSAEYSAAHNYPQTTAGDTQFITDSYQNLLHRTPTASEVSFYLTNVLEQPGTQLQNHAQMLVYFSASSEFLSDVQITATNSASATHWLFLT